VKQAAALAECTVTFVLLVLFAGAMWPPDSYFAGPLPPPQGVSNIYDFCEFAGLLAFLAIGFLVYRRELPRLALWAWPALALCILCFVSAFWSDEPALVVRRSGTVTLSALFGLYLLARSDFRQLVAMLVKVYALAAAASLILVAAAPEYGTMMGEAYTHAWRGAYADKNDLGMACGIAIILAVYAFYRRCGARWIAVFAIGASLVLLSGSQSKTPVVVMLAALYAALLIEALRRRSGAGFVAAFLLFAAGLLVAGLLAVGWQDALAALGRDATFTNRTRIWHLAVEYIGRRPWLGYGYEAFWRDDNPDAHLVWSLVGFRTPHAHNGLLEIGLGLGIVGMAGAAVAWLAAGYRVLRAAAVRHADHVALAAALLAGTLVENLSEFEFCRSGRLMWTLFVTAIAYLGQEVALRRRQRGPTVARVPAVRTPLRAGMA
jgi:exopolysaccharide production protein ExoQ